MTDILASAHAFLHRHGMHPDDINMHTELMKLRINMEHGLTGSATPSDCQMLPAFVSLGIPPAPEIQVLALDIGGTNLRAALVSFPLGEKPKVDSLISRPLPGLEASLTKEEFLQEIVLFSSPLARKANHLGVCFSYQAKITPGGDGEVLRFGKEVRIENSIGMHVCHELLETFKANGIKNLQSYALVNDTVAAMLGGYAQFNGDCDGVLGFILGTGTNLCYQAASSHVPGILRIWDAPSMVLNIESGVYSGFPQGDFDLLVDKASTSPGTYGSEKMIGGVYQGEVLYHTLCAAAAEGLFSTEFSTHIRNVNKLSARDLSEYSAHPTGFGTLSKLCADENDRLTMSVLVHCLLERAAKLVAITLAAPMEAENMGKHADALVIAEGSTFWKNDALRSLIKQHADCFITQSLGRNFTFIEAENPNLIGAALAVFQR